MPRLVAEVTSARRISRRPVVVVVVGPRRSLAQLVDTVAAGDSEPVLCRVSLTEGLVDIADLLRGQVVAHLAVVDAFGEAHNEQVVARSLVVQHSRESPEADRFEAPAEGLGLQR